MIFSRESLGQAFATIFPEPEQVSASERIQACVDARAVHAFCNPDALTWLDAGRALAASLLDGTAAEANGAVTGMSLQSVSLEVTGSDVVLIKPDDASQHPMLMDWVGMDIAETFACLLRAGAYLGLWATNAPLVQCVELVSTGGIPSAAATYTFPAKEGRWFSVSAYYGAHDDLATISAAPLRAHRRISGAAINSIGTHLRAFGSAPDHHVNAAAANPAAPVVSTVH